MGAPAGSPQQARTRGKTDRRAAGHLARLLRSGELLPVSVPAVEDAARRDLVRARAQALPEGKAAKAQRQAFLRRHALREEGHATGGLAHLRWLATGGGPTAAPQRVVQESVRARSAQPERLARLAAELPAGGKAGPGCPGAKPGTPCAAGSSVLPSR